MPHTAIVAALESNNTGEKLSEAMNHSIFMLLRLRQERSERYLLSQVPTSGGGVGRPVDDHRRTLPSSSLFISDPTGGGSGLDDGDDGTGVAAAAAAIIGATKVIVSIMLPPHTFVNININVRNARITYIVKRRE
uniref:Uncharacterized protein n=1 Tax=Oryza glumipatula TaxID=40148 RepID=A0A0E0AGN8_9ORYZ